MTVVLITGANKGIGFDTARQLTDRGPDGPSGTRQDEHGELNW